MWDSFFLKGLQLPKMKKIGSLQVPAIRFTGKKQLVYQFPIIFLNYDFCEYVKFGDNLWKLIFL